MSIYQQHTEAGRCRGLSSSVAVSSVLAFCMLLFAAPLINLIPGEVGNAAIFATYTLAFPAGVVGGIMALVAIIRQHERAVTVFLATLPLVMYLVLIVAEVISGGEH